MGGKRGEKGEKSEKEPTESVPISRDISKAFMSLSGFVTSIAAAEEAFRHGDNFTR